MYNLIYNKENSNSKLRDASSYLPDWQSLKNLTSHFVGELMWERPFYTVGDYKVFRSPQEVNLAISSQLVCLSLLTQSYRLNCVPLKFVLMPNPHPHVSNCDYL
jgi:hypothetical protein